MRVRELDKNHDWTFGRSKSNYLNGSDAIAQSVKTKLLSLKNDWFLNRKDGTAWFDYLDKNPNTQALEMDCKRKILGIKGVEEITFFDIQLNSETRELLIQVEYNDKFNQSRGVNFNVTDN